MAYMNSGALYSNDKLQKILNESHMQQVVQGGFNISLGDPGELRNLGRAYRPVNSLMKKAMDDLVCFKHHHNLYNGNNDWNFYFLKSGCCIQYFTFSTTRERDCFLCDFFLILNYLHSVCDTGIR